MLRNEVLSISVSRDAGAYGLHVVSLDDRGIPKHSEYSSRDKHGISLLLARSVKRWVESRWTA